MEAGGGETVTLLVFLTTTCASCQPMWEMISAGRQGDALGVDLVVVTPSRALENEQEAHRRTPPGVHLHMGSDTWFAYGVGLAGTIVLVRHRDGEATPWEQPGEVLGSSSSAGPGSVETVVRRWLEMAPRP